MLKLLAVARGRWRALENDPRVLEFIQIGRTTGLPARSGAQRFVGINGADSPPQLAHRLHDGPGGNRSTVPGNLFPGRQCQDECSASADGLANRLDMCSSGPGIGRAAQADRQANRPGFAVCRLPIERKHGRGPMAAQIRVDFAHPIGSESALQFRNERIGRGRRDRKRERGQQRRNCCAHGAWRRNRPASASGRGAGRRVGFDIRRSVRHRPREVAIRRGACVRAGA